MPYYFNLPVITDLTPDQQRAVDETRPLALSGGPGTGKSVVCLWRHIRNHATDTSNSLLLTYTKTLEHYLRQSAISELNNNENDEVNIPIGRVQKWLYHNPRNYDEIIIDEGQDIKKEDFEKFLPFSEKISYGADKRQSIYLKNEELRELLEWLNTHQKFSDNAKITLHRNFRNSREILLFTRSVFPDFLIPQNTINSARGTGLKPIMQLKAGKEMKGQVEKIVSIIRDFQSDTHNIAVLVPFAKKVDEFFNAINDIIGNEIQVSKYQNEHDDFYELSGVHVTTFKSAKGTEFDTVIIPFFDKYKWILENIDVVSKNDYYVAFTRAKTNLFLICRSGFPYIGNRETVNIE